PPAHGAGDAGPGASPAARLGGRAARLAPPSPLQPSRAGGTGRVGRALPREPAPVAAHPAPPPEDALPLRLLRRPARRGGARLRARVPGRARARRGPAPDTAPVPGRARRRRGGRRRVRGWLGRPTIPVPLGKCVGGTTVVNSGTCFRTPERVLREWASAYGVADADPAT